MIRSGEHALWEAHLTRGAAMRDMTVYVDIAVRIGRSFEQSMLKVDEAVRSLRRLQRSGVSLADMARKLGDPS